jgi:hypothetical protein
MGVITDNETYEKIVIFGGIQNEIVKVPDGETFVKSFLSNQCYLLTIH